MPFKEAVLVPFVHNANSTFLFTMELAKLHVNIHFNNNFIK